MDGIATPLDYPAAEKTYSHVRAGPGGAAAPPRDSHDSHDSHHSNPTHGLSLTDSHHEPHEIDLISAPLSPTTTRQSAADIGREVTRFTTHGTTYTRDPSFEVDFDVGSDEDPRNWSTLYKSFAVFNIAFATSVVVLYSTSYTATLSPMKQDFGLTGDTVATLGLTFYLIGLAAGSVLCAPLSETFGRRPVYVVAMFLFFVLVAPVARADNITTVIVVRFFAAVAGSATIANAPGSIGDIIPDDYRALVFSVWSIAPMNMPIIGPLLSGFVTYYAGWRWMNWVVFIWGAAACLLMAVTKETYSPVLLQKKAKKMRVDTGEKYWSKYDVRVPFLELMKVNLSRPFSMSVREPICIFWNVYIGLVYGILYLCFVSYPIVFNRTRGWSIAYSGLPFLGILIGNMTTICLASPIKKMINAHKRDATGQVPPEAMMSVVCIAAILIPLGELWFAWTCLPTSINPIISIAAGIPFGMGNGAVFIYASNYLVHSYGIYAASAMAGNAVVRSVLGGVMPLAGTALYTRLSANWAGTLLGLLEVAIIPIPFVFYRYGYRIREKSTLIREMREIEAKQAEKKRKFEARQKRMQLRENIDDVVVVAEEKTARQDV